MSDTVRGLFYYLSTQGGHYNVKKTRMRLLEINKGTSVNVEFETVINDGEHKQRTHFSTLGRFYIKNKQMFLQFKEEQNESGDVNQIIKIDHPHHVTVLRKGAVSMMQKFMIGKETEGTYRSSLGTMLMNTYTSHIQVKLDEDKALGSIQLSYRLHMQQQYAGNYHVTINFRRNYE